MNKVIYLERNFETNELVFPSDNSENIYVLGDLYLTSLRDFPDSEYEIRYYTNELIGYDRLQSIIQINEDQFVFQLISELFNYQVYFLVNRIPEGHKTYKNLWVLKEIDPLALDTIEAETGYNLIGNTNISL